MMLSNLKGGARASSLLKNTRVAPSVLEALTRELRGVQMAKDYVADCSEIRTVNAAGVSEAWKKSKTADPTMTVGPSDKPHLFCASPAKVTAPDDEEDDLIPRTEAERTGEVLEKLSDAELASSPELKEAKRKYLVAKKLKEIVENTAAEKAVDVAKYVRIIKTIATLLLRNAAYKKNELQEDAKKWSSTYDAKIHRMKETEFDQLVSELKVGTFQTMDTVEMQAKKAAAYLFFAERQCAAVVKPMKECKTGMADVADYATGSPVSQNVACARVGKTKQCTSARSMELYRGESKIADLTKLLTKLNRDEKAARELKAKKDAAAFSLSGGSQLRDLLARA
jgi:hypothetical protein